MFCNCMIGDYLLSTLALLFYSFHFQLGKMSLVNSVLPVTNAKDSRWLTLEVCREYQRNKCSRSENECKFAHPPAHVEVNNGRVVCCFDSLKVS